MNLLANNPSQEKLTNKNIAVSKALTNQKESQKPNQEYRRYQNISLTKLLLEIIKFSSWYLSDPIKTRWSMRFSTEKARL
jgi:hypothetical protein